MRETAEFSIEAWNPHSRALGMRCCRNRAGGLSPGRGYAYIPAAARKNGYGDKRISK